MTARTRPRRGHQLAVACSMLGVALAGLLVGCSSTDTSTESPPTPTLPPVPTVVPDVGEPIDLTCEDLVPTDAMHGYSASVRFEGQDEKPDSDELADIARHSGLLCQWHDAESGSDINIGVASLDKQSITALANRAVRESNAVPTYGSEGYFAYESGIGTAQIFDGKYWIVLVSADFTEPGIVAPIASAALDSLS